MLPGGKKTLRQVIIKDALKAVFVYVFRQVGKGGKIKVGTIVRSKVVGVVLYAEEQGGGHNGAIVNLKRVSSLFQVFPNDGTTGATVLPDVLNDSLFTRFLVVVND